MTFPIQCFVFFISLLSAASAAEPWSALVSPSNSLEFKFLKEETPVAHATVIGWGPNWQWVGVGASEKAKGDKLDVTTEFVVNKDRGDVIDIRFRRRKGVRNRFSNRFLTPFSHLFLTARSTA
jgi:hypothetical protein